MTMKKILSIYILTTILNFVCFATGPLTKFIDNDLMRNANISILVKDIHTGVGLYKSNESKSTIPASTMKLVTTASALEMLGPDFRFETRIEIDGKIGTDSTLLGNIYIKGGGDPTLGSEYTGNPDFLNIWTTEIKKAGIKTIAGCVLADESIYNTEAVNPKWTWEDMGNYYAAGVYGLSYKDNAYRLILKSGVAGTKPEILRTDPEIKGLKFENNLLSTNISYDSAYLYGIPRTNFRIIRGAIPANKDEFVIKGDNPDPGSLLISDFQGILIKSGIKVNMLNLPESTRRIIYTHYSPPLSEIISEINVRSNNHYAEHVFRYLSVKFTGRDSFSGAISAIKDFWKQRDLPTDQLFMVDGSGLSPSNAVSAQFLVNLLEYMNKKSAYSDVFMKSLPVSGINGTLTSFLKNSKLKGKVMAKSGTIARVKCYAGYVDLNNKKRVFAVMVNNANGSSKAVTNQIEKFLIDISK
jgi:D-alanyl-D-alanine carboxypeptidase/D-alanyl-D-alanine-endopeptidase (penicillin-binding protein 4)